MSLRAARLKFTSRGIKISVVVLVILVSRHSRLLREGLQAAQEEAIYLYRGNVLRTPSFEKENSWLRSREQAQLQTLNRFRVFHDFQFSDRVSESGITFKNIVVDDAAKQYK